MPRVPPVFQPNHPKPCRAGVPFPEKNPARDLASLLTVLALLPILVGTGWPVGPRDVAAEVTNPPVQRERGGRDLAATEAMPLHTEGGPGAGRVIYLPILSPQQARVTRPRFDEPAGLRDAPFGLRIASDTPGAIIRYTTDGSAPRSDHGIVYRGPLPIERTTTLRAAAFRADMRPSPVASASYLFPADILAQPDGAEPGRWPAFWGIYEEIFLTGQPVPADYGMDPEVTGDPRSAGRLPADLRALPSVSLLMDPSDLFGQPPDFGSAPGIYARPLEQGDAWERPVSVELLEDDGGPGFQVDAGIRIAGDWSRRPDVTPKHSFSLRFRSDYGPGRLEYPLFAGSSVASFDTLRLRAGQADSFPFLPRSLYVHDEWGRRSQLAMGGPSARGRYVHVYLNGRYWGLYNLTEEPTAAFAEEHQGGGEEEWDVVKGREIIEVRHGKPVAIPSWEMEDGEPAAWEALLAIPAEGPASDPQQMARMEALLDIDQHIDYTLLQIYAANDDWLGKNWRAMRRRLPGERWQILVWDIERSVFLRAIDPRCGDGRDDGKDCDVWQVAGGPQKLVGDIANTRGVMGLHGWLSGSPDYRLRLADRARRLFYEDGLLTPHAVRDRFASLLAEVEPGIAPESARWGDAGPQPRTRNATISAWSLFWNETEDRIIRHDPHWLSERDRLLDQAVPLRTDIVIQQLCRAGMLPPVAPLRADLDGDVDAESGARLTISHLPGGCPGARQDGEIYYTLDGSDPRQPGSSPPGTWWSGQRSSAARPYRGPVDLRGYLHLRARRAVPSGDGLLWGPEVSIQAGRPDLRFSEIHYHPRLGDSEFLEIENRSRAPADLSGARFEGITMTLPAGSRIPPGGFLVVADDSADFRAHHPEVPLAGQFQGGLSNGGERIRLLDAGGAVLIDQTYRDDGFWPRGADRLGHSLVPREGAGPDLARPDAWRESAEAGGSPGRIDPAPPWAPVILSEILANSDPPYEDAVELYNPGPAPADISGWWLSDDEDALGRVRIPEGTVLAPGGYAVIYEQALRAGGEGGEDGFGLSSEGESIFLVAASREGRPLGYLHGWDFGPSAPNMSIGRHANREGLLELVPQTRPSFGVEDPASVSDFRRGSGSPNIPRIGPPLIAELMIEPAPGEMEWIELYNAAGHTVHLFDPDDRTRTWGFSDGVDFTFPPGAFLLAGGRALVVGGDPSAFRRAHELPADVPVFGPFEGRLDDAGERLALAMPFEEPDEDGSPIWIDLEWLDWAPDSAWPVGRPGISVERREPATYANQPQSWIGLRTGGTPGRSGAMPQQVLLPMLGR